MNIKKIFCMAIFFNYSIYGSFVKTSEALNVFDENKNKIGYYIKEEYPLSKGIQKKFSFFSDADKSLGTLNLREQGVSNIKISSTTTPNLTTAEQTLLNDLKFAMSQQEGYFPRIAFGTKPIRTLTTQKISEKVKPSSFESSVTTKRFTIFDQDNNQLGYYTKTEEPLELDGNKIILKLFSNDNVLLGNVIINKYAKKATIEQMKAVKKLTTEENKIYNDWLMALTQEQEKDVFTLQNGRKLLSMQGKPNLIFQESNQ